MRCTQQYLEGVSQTWNQIIQLRLEDEQMGDLWMHVLKSTSVIPNCDTKIGHTKLQPNFTEKLKCSLAQDGTND